MITGFAPKITAMVGLDSALLQPLIPKGEFCGEWSEVGNCSPRIPGYNPSFGEKHKHK